MVKINRSEGGSYKNPDPGPYQAVCQMVVDCGTQVVEWKGSKKMQRKLFLRFELEGAETDDGRPLTIGSLYTNSDYDQSKFMKVLNGWRGKPMTDDEIANFDVKDMLDKRCTLTVVHKESNGKTYANIDSVSLPMDKNFNGQCKNPPVCIDLDRPETVEAGWAALPKFLKEKIKASPEFEELVKGGMSVPQDDEDDRRAHAEQSQSNSGAQLDDEIPF